MALNLGNVDNNLGGLKLNSRINSNKKSFSSNSVAAIKKKKNDFNIPIIKDLTTSKSDLPEIPQSKVVKVNSSEKKSFSDLPKINTSNSKNNEKINLPDIKQTISSNAINKNYKGTSASFGDLAEGTAKTVSNIGVNLGTGILKYGEQAMDSMIQFGSSKYNPYYIFNPDKLESHQQIAEELIEKDTTSQIKDILGYNKKLSSGKTVEEELEKDSLVKHDNLAGQVAQGIGNQLPNLLLGQGVIGSNKLKEAVSLGGMSIASFGGGVETAYNNGGSHEDATKYGLLNSAIEIASEKAFAGIGGVFGTGALDEKITDTIISRINSEIVKKLATIGISAVGEGTEELISNLFQPIAQKLTYAKEEDLLKLYKDQNYLEDFISGALSSIGLEAMTLPANNTRVNNFAENNQNQNMNTQEEKIKLDNVINSPENNINLKDLQSSNINIPENINSTLNPPKNDINMQNNDNSNNSKNINYQSDNNLDFSKQVDKVIEGVYPKSDMLIVSDETPKVLQNIGLNNYPITLTQRHLNTIINAEGNYKNANYHNLGVELIKKIPEAISKPLNILQSDTDKNSIVVITDLADNLDKPIIASIKIDGKGVINNIEIDSNVMTSAYGRNNYDNFMKRNIEKGNLLYDIDEGIIKRIGGKLQLRPTNSTNDNISQTNDNVKSDTSSIKYSMQKDTNNTQELDNSSFSLKKKQLEIIKNSNPVEDNYHTWIRSIDDIKTFEETLNDSDYKEYFEAGEDFDETYTAEMAKKALETGKITVYSSYPIEQGIFVSPSKMEAESYSGNRKIYSKQVNINDVAWIDPTQGQYAKMDTKYSQQNDEWQEHLEKNYKATGTRTKLNDQKILPPINNNSENIKKAMIPIREDLKEVNSLNKELKKEIKELKTEINKINTAVESNNKKINLPDKNYYKDQMKIYSEIDYNSLSPDGKKLYNEFMNKAKTELNIPMDPTKETSYNSKEEIKKIDAKKSRIEVSKKYREQAKEFVKDTELWKDKQNLWKYKVNTMKRNLRDIMDVKQANSIYSEYFEPISENNAKIEKEIEKYNEKIRKLNLNNKESVIVQMFGEYKYNPETMVTWQQIHEYMENNHLDHNKIENAIEVFRNTYDELYQRVNTTLAEQGYSTIEYKKGYFPHFKKTHGTTVLTKFAEKLGWKTNDQQLPTDIAGLTENFLPGKRWTSFSQHREGKITDYDALQGFDNYIRGAMDIIYHTEDIQKLRAFENEIRYQHSEKGIQEQIDAIDNNSLLYEEEKIKQKEQVFKEANNPLPNFVTELRDYTNNLANKKSSLDRSTEQFFGRKIYNTMTNVQNRVSANMVGLNISSALTNFIPITQAWSQVKTKNLAQAIKLSVMDNIYSDNFSEKSVYLTNRTKQAERLSKTKLENITDKAGFLFEKIDEFTSNVIVRGKYLENIENGMSETQAIKNADEFAKDVMAGRSKGDMPTIFNAKNPIVKTFTAFQLEVNNQYGYMLKDLPNDLRDKGLNKLIGAFFKMFIGAWLYNKISDKVTGRKSAFSPIDTLSEIVSTSSNDKLSSYDKLKNSIENVAQDVPFIGGLLGGGRLPISSAIPDVGTTIESITNLSDEDKRDSAIANLKKELAKPFFYVAMPLGGGQAKKTIEGLSMYSSDKDIKGSYTASGKLRFPVSEDLGSKVQAAIFGQYANENAKEYFDNNRSPLTEKQQEELKKLNIPISKYWSYRDDLKEINKIESDKDEDGKAIKGSANGKKAYQIMNNDNYSKDEKQYLLDSITSTENKVKIEDLKTIGNNEEVYKYYYSLNNDGKTEMLNAIKKYNFTGKQLLDFSNVSKNETKNAKENIINYLIKSDLTDEQKNYLYSKNYSDASTIINSKIPMNSYLNLQLKINNYSSSGNKKNYVMQEIASLPGLNPTQKILLTYFSGYSIGNNDYKGFSSDSARKAAFDYIDNLNISLAEKRTICEKAGFKVYTNGKIGW